MGTQLYTSLGVVGIKNTNHTNNHSGPKKVPHYSPTPAVHDNQAAQQILAIRIFLRGNHGILTIPRPQPPPSPPPRPRPGPVYPGPPPGVPTPPPTPRRPANRQQQGQDEKKFFGGNDIIINFPRPEPPPSPRPRPRPGPVAPGPPPGVPTPPPTPPHW